MKSTRASDTEYLRELVLARLEAGDEIVFDDLLSISARRRGPIVGCALDTQAIADLLAERSGTEPGKTRMQLASIKRRLRESLLAGKPHSLADALQLRTVAGETCVSTDSTSGRRTISAGVPVLGAELHGETAMARLAGRHVTVRAERGFADELAKKLRPQIFVVMPEKDMLADTLQYHFQRRGWDVIITSEIAQAAEAVRGAPVSLVICDLRVDGAQQLAREVKSHPWSGPVALLSLLPAGRVRPDDAEGFRVLGDSELEQPFELGELLEAASVELARGDMRGTDVLAAARMELVTTTLAIEHANAFMLGLFGRSGIDEEGLIGVSAAYREALANAARHGNAGDPGKLIHIKYLLTSDAISVSITDEGHGFNAEAALHAARDPEVLESVREKVMAGYIGGLGIMMMTRCVDEVYFSARGNSMTLVKRL